MSLNSPDCSTERRCSVALQHNGYVQSVSHRVADIERVCREIGGTDLPVLLIGESGAGKQAVAKYIHHLSKRNREPFISFRCAGLTPEFFRGCRWDGRYKEKAATGTVFLDSIDEVEYSLQSKLLNLLPDGERVATGPLLGARVISSSVRGLEDVLASNGFRDDLYYRVNGVCLRLPPLRERKEDIPQLIAFFLRKYADAFNRSETRLSAATLQGLMEYSWPGNIRELENAISIVVATGDEGLAVSGIQGPAREPRSHDNGGSTSLKKAARTASRRAERELILRVLERTRWNRKRAAEQLQVSYKALLYKMKQVGVQASSDYAEDME
jgi:two-component system, NtrC family, response regulator AtoC